MQARLPALFDTWLRDILDDVPDAEPRAACHDCVLCSPTDWSAGVPSTQFTHSTRCCTYTPDLWNHQVGRILARPEDISPYALAALRARIRDVETSQPIGVMPTDSERQVYAGIAESGRFGRAQELRCPYLDPVLQGCGVWPQRNAVCATWHCRHEHGTLSMGLWNVTRDLLKAVEKTLAAVAVQELIPGDDGTTWAAWDGEREDFFLAAAEIADRYRWADVAHRASPTMLEIVAVTRRAFAAFRARALPERLTRHQPGVVVASGPDGVRVAAYRDIDAALIPADVYGALDAFDGRPAGEVVEELAGRGVHVDDATLWLLVEQDLLR
jgi:hypothetical protein